MKLQEYISVNLFAIIGWCDLVMTFRVIYMYFSQVADENYPIGFYLFPISVYLLPYWIGKLIVIGILMVIFVIEKFRKRKNNYNENYESSIENNFWNTIWLIGIISFVIYQIIFLKFCWF